MFLSFDFILILLKLFIYLFLFLFLFLFFLLSLIYGTQGISKKFVYECGFDTFIDMNTPLEIHFYLVCLLYILFDVEIILLLPFLLGSGLNINVINGLCVIDFLLILMFGYLIEYYSGVLTWVEEINLRFIDGFFFEN